MASIVGIKRRELVALLIKPGAEKMLPVEINWMGPGGVVMVEEGIWRLRALRCNEEKAEAERLERVAAGVASWMPENTWPFYEPAEMLLEAPEKADFIAQIEAMDWPYTPDDYEASGSRLNPLAAMGRLIKPR